MRTKNKLWTSVALMLLVGVIMAGIAPVQAQPTLRLLPAPTITYDLGQKFNITLNIESIPDLGAWTADIEWDPSVLNYTGTHDLSPPVEVKDRMWEGPFVKGAGATNFLCTKAAPGNLTGLTVSLQSPGTGASGSGLLATFELEVVGYGSTGINVTYDALVEGDLTTVYTVYNVVNTDFLKSPPPPYGPTVDFTWPTATYYEDDNVTFTATSTAGYHINTGFLPVMNYTWDFGDGTGTVVDDVSGTPGAPSTVTHNFTTAGTWTVNVTVQTADNPGGDPLETGSKDKQIVIYVKALSYVDVYTEKMGSGPEIYGSAFEPGEEVTISAELKYMGVLVNSTYVGFQLLDVSGDDVAYRSAITVGGIATIDVRLPLMGTEHLTGESDFGLFKCIATANVFEESFNDTVTLNVGWIVATSALIAQTPRPRGSSTQINVTVTNYALETKPVYLSIVIYDSVGTAIGVYSTSFTISAASYSGLNVNPYSTLEQATVQIPSNAWPGTATVYANAFDKEPLLGGDAWCSEITTTCDIT